MCNSVLSNHLAKRTSQYDLEEDDGQDVQPAHLLSPGHIVMFFWHDVGKALIGQNDSRKELRSWEPVQVQRFEHGFFTETSESWWGGFTSRVL